MLWCGVAARYSRVLPDRPPEHSALLAMPGETPGTMVRRVPSNNKGIRSYYDALPHSTITALRAESCADVVSPMISRVCRTSQVMRIWSTLVRGRPRATECRASVGKLPNGSFGVWSRESMPCPKPIHAGQGPKSGKNPQGRLQRGQWFARERATARVN